MGIKMAIQWALRIHGRVTSVLFSLFLVMPIHAQSPLYFSKENDLSLHFGLGPSTYGKVAAGAQLEWANPVGLFIIRSMTANESLALVPKNTPVERNVDVGFMYGWRIYKDLDEEGDRLGFSLAGGMANTLFLRRGDVLRRELYAYQNRFELIKEWYPSVAYEMKITWGRKDRASGVSFSYWGNVNMKDNFFGLQLGWYLHPPMTER